MDLMPDLLKIAIIHFLGVILPGQDFAIIVKNSLVKSHQQALLTASGIATGMLIHFICYISGFNLLIKNSPQILVFIKNLGGIYLIYLAIQAIRTAKATPNYKLSTKKNTNLHAFFEGFWSHTLNSSAFLYLLSLFTAFVQINTTLNIKILYAMVMISITLLWFSVLSLLISIPKFKRFFLNFQRTLNLLFAIVIGAMGIFILINQ